MTDPTTTAFDARTSKAGEEWYERRRAEGVDRIRQHRERIDGDVATSENPGAAVGADVGTRVVVGKPAAALVEAADDWNADLVVDSHGRIGVRRILSGSVAEQAVRTAPTPVTAVRRLLIDTCRRRPETVDRHPPSFDNCRRVLVVLTRDSRGERLGVGSFVVWI